MMGAHTACRFLLTKHKGMQVIPCPLHAHPSRGKPEGEEFQARRLTPWEQQSLKGPPQDHLSQPVGNQDSIRAESWRGARESEFSTGSGVSSGRLCGWSLASAESRRPGLATPWAWIRPGSCAGSAASEARRTEEQVRSSRGSGPLWENSRGHAHSGPSLSPRIPGSWQRPLPHAFRANGAENAGGGRGSVQHFVLFTPHPVEFVSEQWGTRSEGQGRRSRPRPLLAPPIPAP